MNDPMNDNAASRVPGGGIDRSL